MAVTVLSGDVLRALFDHLLEMHGPQHWWPADTPFEVMVGAILTQNTAWTNVERAIDRLDKAACLTPERIVGSPDDELTTCLQPSGYFNVKAKRLRAFCAWYLQSGGLEALRKLQTTSLRKGLLSVNGVGPETADDMLLYAFERPVFVIDAYTRRIFSRFGLIAGDESYEELRAGVEQALGADAGLFNEYHALLVRHAKSPCSKRPVCETCGVAELCAQCT